jgi:glycine cleavage system H protein
MSAAPFVHRGCELPDDLLYAVEKDVWARLEGDGTATLGMTDPAQTRCGKIVHIRFKPVGRQLARWQSAATIESAKWVGPFPTPVSGEIVATNEDGFRKDILAANKDPYGAGWLVRVRPSKLDDERGGLAAGEAARNTYVRRIDDAELSCFRCAERETM